MGGRCYTLFSSLSYGRRRVSSDHNNPPFQQPSLLYNAAKEAEADAGVGGKEKFGASAASHTMHTEDEMFVGVQFKLEGETRKYKVSGTVPSDDAGSTTCFTATALRGDNTIQIPKVALLDVLGKGANIELHEVCTKCAAVTYSVRCDKCKGKICGS
jgi:hypothetical protein